MSGFPPFQPSNAPLILALCVCHVIGLSSAQETTSFSWASETGGIRAKLQGTWQPGQDYIIEDSTDLVSWNRVSPVMKPVQGTLDWSHKQSLGGGEFYSGTSLFHRNVRRFYRLRKLPPADAPPQTISTVPTGRLSQPNGPTNPVFYTTSSGWNITLDRSTVTITSADGKATYQHWGHPHENLNGKHLKDWLGVYRTMILPGDVTITMKATGPQGVVEALSIYDVDQTHKIDTTNNSVILSTLLVRVGETSEPDGETMRFFHIGNGRYYTENVYTQDTAGDGTDAVQHEVPLGSTGGDANPNQVNDLYDDPRLGHT